MRKVKRNYSVKPQILQQAATIAEWNKIARTGNTKLIKTKIYADSYKTKDGNRSRVLDELAKYYWGKCAYCERLYKLDVEHYRPKGRISDENGKLISKKGYYWLCYEWSNLLPGCISCNREGGKVDKFPVIGNRVTGPRFSRKGLNTKKCLISNKSLISEVPYLVNPETDNPSAYFDFKISDNGKGIEIIGIDKMRRGEKTIQICKLNRYELRIQRAQIIAEFRIPVHIAINKLQKGVLKPREFSITINNLIEALYRNSKEKQFQHTLLRKKMIADHKHFELLVLPFIAKSARNTILAAFKKFKPV